MLSFERRPYDNILIPSLPILLLSNLNLTILLFGFIRTFDKN